MTLALSLATMFGKPLADRLIKGLMARKSGAERFEQATAAMSQGLTAVDALKDAFGKEFLSELNDVLGTTGNSRFSYEAGTQSYIRLSDESAAPVKILRDELNINLDRLAVLTEHTRDIRNQFMGLVSVWHERCKQFYGSTHAEDIESTFSTINNLLKGESRNYRQIYQLLSSTSLGGVGALMLISGVFIATGTGVGLVSAISLFLFGVPWLSVGALVLPGALLMALAAKKTRPVDEISLSVALAYKLLERFDGGPKSESKT
ncbi:hypothetical protein PFX98_04715 [Paucibacter sediminis]|uniref:Uncharacterized protein n=1 Tax=Paucibacter sediminis TaxID=3019553 RepID=A0AA95ND01_9BURK|nr:hypothetical protein [Paucibacter sp. S2-9]WIT12915.1 hypothetical protein PFX98_04715 [Paucibacter sp. S2-9]